MGLAHLQNTSMRSTLPRKGRRRLRGYKTYVDNSGLIHIVPRTQRVSSRFTLYPVFVLLALGIAFKALAMLNIGLNDYEAKVTELQSGSFLEQSAAMVLTVDPASIWLYQSLQPLFP